MQKRSRLLPEKARRHPPDTPLAIVNIVFLLLFFFLSTGSLVNGTGFDMDLSKVTDLPADDLPKPILIVEEGGGVSLNGVPVKTDDLAAALKDYTFIHVLIDRNAPAQDLLDLLATPGFDSLDVRLVTRQQMAVK